MSDESLNKVLKGIIGQCLMNHDGKSIKMQYLESFIYSNNELGLKSLHNIKLLILHIFEFCLNNIRLDGGYLNGKHYSSSDVLEEIVRSIAMSATKLMKLKLTKMNLKSEGIIH